MSVTNLQIIELENFFATKPLPKEVQLYKGVRIIDVKQFLESHFAVLKAENSKGVNDAFYERLVRLQEVISEKE